MKKHERILNTYKRNHKGENFEDAEKRKISNEKQQVNKLKKKAKSLVNKALLASNDSIVDDVEVVLHKSKKVAGNMKSHKSRLTELQKNEDFK